MISTLQGRSVAGTLTGGVLALAALAAAPAAAAAPGTATPPGAVTAPAAAAAATTVRSDQITPFGGGATLPAGWSRQLSGSGGDGSVQGDDRSTGNGVLHLYAPAHSAVLLRHPVAASTPLGSFTAGSYDAEVVAGTAPAPYQLQIDCNGAADGGTVTLSFVPPAQTASAGWNKLDVVQGDTATWQADATIDANGNTTDPTGTPGPGGIAAGTPTPLSTFKSVCSAGVVLAYGVDESAADAALESVVDGVTFNGEVSDFLYAPVYRISGSNRVATAIQASRTSWADGAAGGVVLANSSGYADGLSGGPLATAFGGPVLLNPQGALDSGVKGEIQRVLKVKDKNGYANPVFLVGGTAALSGSVESALKSMGYQTVRLAGSDRYGTAVKVADFLGQVGYPLATALLTSGNNFPDALSAAPAAAHTNGVVLLTNGTKMPAATQQFLTAHPKTVRWAIGHDAVVASPGIPSTRQVYGTDRYETSSKVAKAFFTTVSSVELASGESFPDALGAGAYAGSFDAPLLLVRTSVVPSTVSTYLSSVHASTTFADVFGGTGSVTDAVLNRVEGLLNPTK